MIEPNLTHYRLTDVETEEKSVSTKLSDYIKDQQYVLKTVRERLAADTQNNLIDEPALSLALKDLLKVYEDLENSDDAVTVAPVEGQPRKDAKQTLKLNQMWVALLDRASHAIMGFGRQHDENFFKILHVLVKRGKNEWDQPFSIANTVQLSGTTELEKNEEKTLPPEKLRTIETSGFVLLPYFCGPDGHLRMWVSAEKAVVGAGLSVPAASVGNLEQLKTTGISGMFGGKLKQLIAIKQEVTNHHPDFADINKFLVDSQLYGPMASEDRNRGTQNAVYIPVELSEAEVTSWLRRGGRGVFVPIYDLKRLKPTDLLMGHTKNGLDVLEAVEHNDFIAVTRLLQASFKIKDEDQ